MLEWWDQESREWKEVHPMQTLVMDTELKRLQEENARLRRMGLEATERIYELNGMKDEYESRKKEWEQ